MRRLQGCTAAGGGGSGRRCCTVAAAAAQRAPAARRPCAPAPRAAGGPGEPAPGGPEYGSSETVHDVATLLAEIRQQSQDMVFEDDDQGSPAWEWEGRFRSTPLTAEELAAAAAEEGPGPAQLLGGGDPLAAVAEVVSAYSPERGFREVSAEELSVALTAGGGLVGLVLDVRSTEEFEAGPVLPGALSLPLEALSDAVRAGQLDDYIDQHVVVVCATGQRSAQATVRLGRVFGFQHVANLAGGVAAWQAMQQRRERGGGGSGCGCGGGGCH